MSNSELDSGTGSHPDQTLAGDDDTSDTLLSAFNRPRATEDIKRRLDGSTVPFPDTMSCQTQFDLAMGCSGMMGKFRHVYRYGGWRSCSEVWSDFWFCMRTRTYPKESKQELIRDRYYQKELKVLSGPNSEDVWRERDKKLQPFFHLDPREVAEDRKSLAD